MKLDGKRRHFTRDNAVVLAGRVSHPRTDRIQLERDGHSQSYPIDNDGHFRITLVPKVDSLEALALTAEGFPSPILIQLIQDSTVPILEILNPIGGDLVTSASSVDIEVRVVDTNLLHVTTGGQPLEHIDGDRWMARDVPLPYQGENEIVIEALDRAEHRSTVAVTIVRDRNPESVASNDSRDGSQLEPQSSPTPEDVDESVAIGYLAVGEGDAVHDFGDLTQGVVSNHTFQLVTKGNSPVSISQISASCGCTVVQARVVSEVGSESMPYEMGSPIGPRAQLLVDVQLDTKNRRGPVRSVVTVTTDPSDEVQLKLMANVAPFFEVSPRSLNFGTVEHDRVVEQELTVTCPTGVLYALTAVEEELPEEVSVRVVPVDPREDGRANTWRVKVTLGPNIPEGLRRNYQIKLISDQVIESSTPLLTNEVSMREAVVYATASVLGKVSAAPSYLSFGLMRGGQVTTRTVRIENHDDEFEMMEPQLVLKGYQGEFEYPEIVSFEIAPLVNGGGYDITMTLLPPEEITVTIRGKVVVEVGHPNRPTLEVPFTGVVRR